MLRPAVNDIKEMENREGVHSELVTKLLTMVPELLAFLVTQRRRKTNQRGQDLKHLHELESRLFESALTFIEGVLRMGKPEKSNLQSKFTKWQIVHNSGTLRVAGQPQRATRPRL